MSMDKENGKDDIQAIRAIWSPGHAVDNSPETVLRAASTIIELCDKVEAKDEVISRLMGEVDRSIKLTPADVKNISMVFQECEFKADEGSCDYCESPTARTWWERTNHEVEEGNYYCDFCALKEVLNYDHQGEWFEKRYYKDKSADLQRKLDIAIQCLERVKNQHFGAGYTFAEDAQQTLEEIKK